MRNEELMAKVVDSENVRRAYEQVKRNGGAAGVDGMSVEAYAAHAARHWAGIEAKLRAGHYQPGAVRAVSIPKAQGGERRLGIPNVQDRVIQQALLQVLGPILDGEFSPHSYGYRPGRSAHDAIRAARAYGEEGKTWGIDLDISAFFDEVNHDRLMARLGRTVRDPQVLRLIGAYLRAPVRSAGRDEKRSQGTPQGSPRSPLLANLYLDALDQERAQRGVSFCRYADDVAIFVGSQRSGERILESLTAWIATHLHLRVNASKSGVDRPWNGQFLGLRITEDRQIAPAPRSVERLKEKVRGIWNARWSVALEERIHYWQRYLRGWWNYFRVCDQRRDIDRREGWMRRHMRKYFWQRWHNRKGRLNALRRLKAQPYHLHQASGSVGAWRKARSPMLQTVLNNARLKRWGLYVPSDLAV